MTPQQFVDVFAKLIDLPGIEHPLLAEIDQYFVDFGWGGHGSEVMAHVKKLPVIAQTDNGDVVLYDAGKYLFLVNGPRIARGYAALTRGWIAALKVNT
jgi:hypothetical protein